MKRKIYELILIIVFYCLQCTLGMGISLAGIHPNFLLILPVVFGFLNGKNDGIVVGFFAGLMYDLYFSSIIGFTSLVYMFIGYMAGCFFHKYEETEIFIPICLTFMGDICFGFISFVGNFLLHNKLDFFFYFSRIIVPETIYTVVIVLIIYRLLIWINKQINKTHQRRAKSFDKGNI